MSFIDERGRLWGRVNVIDLVVVVVVLAAIAGFGYSRLSDRLAPTFAAEHVELEVEFLVSGVRQQTIDVLTLGTAFFHTQTNERMGTLVDVRVEPAEIVTTLPSGAIVEGVSATRYDVYMTLRGPGRITPNVILLGGQEVRIGTRVPLKSRLASVGTTVMAIDMGDE